MSRKVCVTGTSVSLENKLMRTRIALLVGGLVLVGMIGCPQPTPTPSPPTLTVTLDPSLNVDGTPLATTIDTAELLDGNTTLIASATISSGSAVFDLTNVAAGDFFVRINSLNTAVVPVRITDPTVSVTETVGTTLKPAVIGSLSSPTFVIESFPQAQNSTPVVKYSDGTPISPTEYAYVIISAQASPPQMSVRVLGKGNQIIALTGLASHPGGLSFTQPFTTWILNVQSPLQHGDAFNGIDLNCSLCHGDLNAKATLATDIRINTGWCFRCHYGKTGAANGFVDPSQ